MKKRHRVPDLRKARAAAGGGIGFYSLPPTPEKCCGECQLPRHSVDDSGACGYRDPFSTRAEEIARQAILRADSLGVEHYGPAPAPIDEKRDMYQETIEELLDAIYYLTRQVAKLEDMRQRLAAVAGDRPVPVA